MVVNEDRSDEANKADERFSPNHALRYLIVTKPTNLELHGARVREAARNGLIGEDEVKRLNLYHEQHYRCLDSIRNFLVGSKSIADLVEIRREDDWPTQPFDVVISVGGDGTLLSAARFITMPNTILLGVRSSGGSVGYTCSHEYQDISRLFEDIKNNNITSLKVARMAAKIQRVNPPLNILTNEPQITFPVLNDILFCHQSSAATTVYNIEHREKKETHKSSGMWIASAVGSSAGILAAGGTLLSMDARQMQYRVRELYCLPEQKFELTGGFFSASPSNQKAEMSIEVRIDNAILALDGQRNIVDLNYGDRFSIVAAPDLNLAKPIRSRLQ